MRLARLLRGAASAGPGPRARRSLASDSASASGPAPERGVPGQVDFYARFSPSPLSMKQFLDFGECGPASAFVRGPGRPPARRGAPGPAPPPPAPPRALGASFLPRGRSGRSGAGPAGRIQNRGVCLVLVIVENLQGPGGTAARPAAHVCRSAPAARPLPEPGFWGRAPPGVVADNAERR